jgi:hypothetical protein
MAGRQLEDGAHSVRSACSGSIRAARLEQLEDDEVQRALQQRRGR